MGFSCLCNRLASAWEEDNGAKSSSIRRYITTNVLSMDSDIEIILLWTCVHHVVAIILNVTAVGLLLR